MQETQETWVQTLGQEDPLEEEMATHSSIPAWQIPWTEPGGLQSEESQRVGHNWVTEHTHYSRTWKSFVLFPQKSTILSLGKMKILLIILNIICSYRNMKLIVTPPIHQPSFSDFNTAWSSPQHSTHPAPKSHHVLSQSHSHCLCGYF